MGMLYQNETFAVSETLNGLDSRIYLLLADGRGWAFDDSALMPYDPSVVRGRWSPLDVDQSVQPPVSFISGSDAESKRRRRRKRGGVKRNKAKRAREAAAAAARLAKEMGCD